MMRGCGESLSPRCLTSLMPRYRDPSSTCRRVVSRQGNRCACRLSPGARRPRTSVSSRSDLRAGALAGLPFRGFMYRRRWRLSAYCDQQRKQVPKPIAPSRFRLGRDRSVASSFDNRLRNHPDVRTGLCAGLRNECASPGRSAVRRVRPWGGGRCHDDSCWSGRTRP